MTDGNYQVVRDRLNRVFRDVFDNDEIEISDGMTAADIEDWDSLNHITLVVAVEREFKIRLNAADAAKLDNVGAMINYLLKVKSA